MYPKVAGLIPCKKDQVIEPIANAIPAWIVKDAIDFELMDGFSVKEKTEKTEKTEKINEASIPANIPGFGSPEKDNGELPF
jgi:hypothetical protein